MILSISELQPCSSWKSAHMVYMGACLSGSSQIGNECTEVPCGVEGWTLYATRVLFLPVPQEKQPMNVGALTRECIKDVCSSQYVSLIIINVDGTKYIQRGLHENLTGRSM